MPALNWTECLLVPVHCSTGRPLASASLYDLQSTITTLGPQPQVHTQVSWVHILWIPSKKMLRSGFLMTKLESRELEAT